MTFEIERTSDWTASKKPCEGAVLAHVLLQLDVLRAAHINTVFHVHDEVVCEVINPDLLKMIEEVFAQGPSWAEGLPLKGAGYTGPYYFKD